MLWPTVSSAVPLRVQPRRSIATSRSVAEALRTRLVESQPLIEADLTALAEARASSLRTAILTANNGLATRIVAAGHESGEADDDGNIRMQVRLSASEDLPEPASEDDAAN